MAKQTQYEVLFKQDGRWEINSQHLESEEEDAIKEAKDLEKLNHIEDVKVIREVFDPKEGTSKEFDVYTPGKKKYRPPSKYPKKASEDVETPKKKTFSSNKRKGPSLHYTLMNIIVVCSFSIFLVAVFTWFTSKHFLEVIGLIFQ
jgi:hypothetical protein